MKNDEIISNLRSIIATYNLNDDQTESIEEAIDKINAYGHSYDVQASTLTGSAK